ncbi:MAG: hypothetical protein R2806_10455 [Saprospiraceae bacterium]
MLNEQVRVGASFHTPSVLKLDDVYTTDLTFTYEEDNNTQTNTEQSPQGQYSYRYVLPMRAQSWSGDFTGKTGIHLDRTCLDPLPTGQVRFKDDKISWGDSTDQ